MKSSQEDSLLEQIDVLASGAQIEFNCEHIFSISDFEKNKSFESIPLSVGPFQFKITATKNIGTISFLDLKVHLENPPKFSQKISIRLSIKNTENDLESVSSVQTTTISKNIANLYFSNFVSLKKLEEQKSGFFDTDGNLKIYARFQSSQTEQNIISNQESRETTGFVGLQNQGATCYMNSMLQMLFHLPAFRQTVYSMPTSDVSDPDKSIPLQLQCLFYNLQFSQNAVSTKDLTNSFGWKTQDIMVQHDVHEFNRVLMSKLEEKLKGTDLENNLLSLFKGKNQTVIRCIDVDHESATKSEFTDLQLRVQGNSNLQEAFDSYLETDRLEGDNQCTVEGFGKQDADIGLELVELPPVLQLHLNRFTYDYYKDCIVKINDYFEYPETIDMSPYVNDAEEEMLYDLVGVLVHSGTNYAGHYYAYIKPEPEADWLEFNDDLVRKAKKEDVFKNNFGQSPYDDEDEEEAPKKKKGFQNRHQRNRMFTAKKKRAPVRRRIQIEHSAYLLVYASRDKQKEIYHPENASLPSYLHDYFEKIKLEKEERARQLLENAYNADIQYITEDMLSLPSTVGFSVAKEDQKFMKVVLQGTVAQLYDSFKKVIDGDFTVWQCGAYGNPTNLLSPESNFPVGQILSKNSVLFIHRGKEVDPEKVLIFMKFFDPSAANDKKVQLVGSQFFSKNASISSVFNSVKETLGLESDDFTAFIDGYGGSVRSIANDSTLSKSMLYTGSMITFQGHIPDETITKDDHSSDVLPIYTLIDGFDPRDFSMFMQMKYSAVDMEVVQVPEGKKAVIRTPHSCSISSFKEAISKAMNIEYDPSKDSFVMFESDANTNDMKPIPFRSTRKPLIENILGSRKDKCTVFFELHKGISEEEMQNIVYQRVQISNGVSVTKEFVKLIKNGTEVSELFNILKEDGDVTDDIDEYRFFTVLGTSIWERLDKESTLSDDAVFLRVELTPEDQKNLSEEEFLISCAHDVEEEKDAAMFRPFVLKCNNEESILDLKKRIASFYPIDENEYKKWHLELVYTFAGSDKRVALKDRDTLEEYRKQKNLELEVLHSASRTMGRKHVPLKIFN